MLTRSRFFSVMLVFLAFTAGFSAVSGQAPQQGPKAVGGAAIGPTNEPDSAPPCDQVCTSEVDCNEPCGYTTCGEYGVYGTCEGCDTACGSAVPCDRYCIHEEVMTTCGDTSYGCGPASNCASICQDPVGCDVICWNGLQYTTCMAAGYPCGSPCYEDQIHPVGVWEEVTQWDGSTPVLVNCWASWGWFDVDECASQPARFLACDSPTLLSSNEEPGTCCYYWAYGYGGCGAGWGC